VFRCPATLQATWHAAAHHPVYQYEFRRIIPGHESEGSAHSFDLPYVFGFYPKEGNLAGNYTDVDRRIADSMQRYWVGFAKTGDPNVGSLERAHDVRPDIAGPAGEQPRHAITLGCRAGTTAGSGRTRSRGRGR